MNPKKPLAYHLVARAEYPQTPFLTREICQETWGALSRSFKDCIAAVLMPDHIHLLVWATVRERVLTERFRRLVGGISRDIEWTSIPAAQPVPDIHQVRRQARYIHLNPPRKELCRDPLEWEWSTHRDYLGAVVHPWPRFQENLRAMNFKSAEKFHAYVSEDPSVHPLGTWPPSKPSCPAIVDLAAAERAAILATRSSADAFQRQGRARSTWMRLVCGEWNVPVVPTAEYLGVHRTAVHHSLALPDPHPKLWAPAVLTVLGERRLIDGAGIFSLKREVSPVPRARPAQNLTAP